MWLKALAIKYKTNKRRLKGKEKKADGLSISRLKEQHSGELTVGFFFSSYILYMELKKLTTGKCQYGQIK